MTDLFTVVIQGKLTPDTPKTVAHYRNFGKVIVSTWNNNAVLLEEVSRIPDVTLIASDDPPYRAYNNQHIYCQCYTTLQGLRCVRTKYAIKARSDEFYYNLDPFINKVIKNPNKLVTNNIFFRHDREAKFHPSDHLVGSSTRNMMLTYRGMDKVLRKYWYSKMIKGVELGLSRDLTLDNLLNMQNRKPLGEDVIGGPVISDYNNPRAYHECIVAEQLLCVMFLRTKIWSRIDIDKSREYMIKYIDCVPVDNIGPFRGFCGSCGCVTFTDPKKVLEYRSIPSMEFL